MSKISSCRKLRDEYDKLEGALRKLGVDPESVVGRGAPGGGPGGVCPDDDDAEDEDEELGSRPNAQLLAELDPLSHQGYSSVRASSCSTTSQQQQHNFDPLRLRQQHLDILEEVSRPQN